MEHDEILLNVHITEAVDLFQGFPEPFDFRLGTLLRWKHRTGRLK